jgi:hypothetical protein
MDPTLSSKIDRILERAIGVKLPSNTLSHSTRPDRPLQNLDHDQSIAGVKLPPSSTLSNAPTQTTTVDGKAIKYEIHSAHIAQGPSRSSDLDSASQSLSPEPAPQSSRTSPKKKVRRKQHDLYVNYSMSYFTVFTLSVFMMLHIYQGYIRTHSWNQSGCHLGDTVRAYASIRLR